MNDDTKQFEQRLRDLPMKEIPGDWRAEILAAAREAQTISQRSPVSRHHWFSVLKQRVAALLWPHPRAWAALASAWILVFGFNFAARDTSAPIAKNSSAPSPETVAELKQQRKLYAELMGNGDTREPELRKETPDRPRTGRAITVTA